MTPAAARIHDVTPWEMDGRVEMPHLALENIAIIGAGLLGTSILYAARKRWPEVRLHIHDSDTDTREFVKDTGLANTIIENIQEIPKTDLLLICTPAKAVPNILRTIVHLLRPNTVISDVASVKTAIVSDVSERLPPDVFYVPSHPMAGGSRGGAMAGRGDLLEDKSCIITPLSDTPEYVIAFVEAFWRELGMRTGRASPQLHDEIVALTSHLPHIIAYAMMETAARRWPDGPDSLFAGRSFEDMARLGSANPLIWRDILCMNSQSVLKHLDIFEDTLRTWRSALSEQSDVAVGDCIARASLGAAHRHHRDESFAAH